MGGHYMQSALFLIMRITLAHTNGTIHFRFCVRYVDVTWFVSHVLQLIVIRFTPKKKKKKKKTLHSTSSLCFIQYHFMHRTLKMSGQNPNE
jgi:hypothetical protein